MRAEESGIGCLARAVADRVDAVQDKCHLHDLHATRLALLGLAPERLA